MRKAVAMAALLISVMVSANAYAGEWKSDQNGWWYVQDDGTYIRNAWFTDKDGKSYYFGEDGYMLTDTVTPDGWVVGPDGAWVESEGRPPESISGQKGREIPLPREEAERGRPVCRHPTPGRRDRAYRQAAPGILREHGRDASLIRPSRRAG